jgi:hypothetical protein
MLLIKYFFMIENFNTIEPHDTYDTLNNVELNNVELNNVESKEIETETPNDNEGANNYLKTNIIDTMNNDNNIQSNELIKLCKSIEQLESFHHIEIGKILKLNNVYLNENSNGIFINLNKISGKAYQEISNYIEFVKKQESDINKDEKLKRNLQTTYFKDNKDNITNN